MSKFWQKKYTSKYTGAEIDAAVAKAADATKVTANPTLAGTEAALTGLEVGETKYKVEQPINVVANPTLAGTEAALEGLQVGNTKYKVEVGGGGNWTPDITITATLGSWGGDTKNYNSISAIDKTDEECKAVITTINKKVLLNIDDEGYINTYYMRVCGLSYDQQSEVTAFMLMPDPDYYGYTVLSINTDNLPLNTPIRVMTGSSGIGIFSWNFSNVPKDRYLAYGDLIFGNIKQPE